MLQVKRITWPKTLKWENAKRTRKSWNLLGKGEQRPEDLGEPGRKVPDHS